MAAVWNDLVQAVYTVTNRPAMQAETTLALKQAIRAAHKMGKFWRDMVQVQVVPDPTNQLQSISLSDNCPRLRQLAYVKNADSDKKYDEVTPVELVDLDGYLRYDVYWALGNTLNVRLATLPSAIQLGYYLQPIVDPLNAAVIDWLATDYEDVIVLYASNVVLSAIGEQEIKAQVTALLAIAVADLISDNIEVTGR